jgi:hypothetical protein
MLALIFMICYPAYWIIPDDQQFTELAYFPGRECNAVSWSPALGDYPPVQGDHAWQIQTKRRKLKGYDQGPEQPGRNQDS